jgi:hypothetical protein
MFACGVDPSPSNTSETSADLSTSGDMKVFQDPPQLSADQLKAFQFLGNDAIANACHVTLLFCDDPRIGLPTFSETGCTDAQAVSAAMSLCRQVCGHIDCSVVACQVHGGC